MSTTKAITEILIANQCPNIPDAQVANLAAAADFHVKRHFAPAWQLQPIPIKVKAPNAKASDTSAVFTLIAQDPPKGQDGILAYHTEETGGAKDGPIFAGWSMRNGSTLFTGPYNILATLEHEIDELIVDPGCNDWCDGPIITGKGSSYSKEACDPVENFTYRAGGGTTGTVPGDHTDFVLPNWFDIENKNEQSDYLGKIKGGFKLAPGGYMVVRSGAGAEHQIFAEQMMPEWRKRIKAYKGSRTSKRGVK